MKVLTKKKNSQKMDERGTRVDGCLATGSVIVYVWRQRDAEVVAENIRAAGISGGVAVYHGGMNSVDRNKAQSRVSQLSSLVSL
jgi:ATP-dependent DNA helicase Q4